MRGQFPTSLMHSLISDNHWQVTLHCSELNLSPSTLPCTDIECLLNAFDSLDVLLHLSQKKRWFSVCWHVLVDFASTQKYFLTILTHKSCFHNVSCYNTGLENNQINCKGLKRWPFHSIL